MNTVLVRRLAFKLENHNVVVWYLEVYVSESSVCALYTITFLLRLPWLAPCGK
jgi:hypothetical protein